MATIIQVTGVGNSGKTTSIRKAIEVLRERYAAAIVTILLGRDDGVDIIVEVEIEGRVIVLASGGDTPAILQRLFDIIARIEWDVLVCASKSRGQTVDFLNTKGAGHDVVPIGTTWRERADERERANTDMVERIVQEIEQALPPPAHARRRA